MFVVHALWRRDRERGPGRLALWAEDSTAPVPRRKPGRAPKVRPHPFAAPHELLTQMLDSTGDKVGTLTVRLPTRGSRPLDSPQLVRDQVDQAAGATTAELWQVPVVEFDADTAARTLADLDFERATPGASTTHLVELVRFAADLVTRGRLLPGVALDPPRATWRPVLTGPDAAWTRTLAQSQPPSMSAADPEHPLTVWADALDSLVDAAARAAAGRTRLAPARGGDPVTRAWLGALTGPERRFTATAAEAATLAEDLAAWQRDVLTGPVRACFRLVEPAETASDQTWQVRLALQATDEPSLVVDAAQVWRARGQLPALARQLDSPQETLLAELGKARRVYPELDAALRTARPTVLPLDTTAAHCFLQAAAPALATAGFGVQLPGWWTRPASRLGVRITASTPSQPGAVAGRTAVGAVAITEFRHDLAVGGEVLTADELAELASLKSPLVRLRGVWIEVDARRLAAGLRLVGRTGTATVGELLRLGLGSESESVEGLPVESVQADGWLGDLLAGDTERRLTPVAVPDSFDGRLRPYQERGLAWLDFPAARRSGRAARRRHGPGQDGPAARAARARRRARSGGRGVRPQPAGLPDVAGRQLAAGGGAVRPGPAGARAPRRRAGPGQGLRRRGRRRPTWSSPPTRWPPGTPPSCARSRWHRVVLDEAQAIKNAATRQAAAVRALPAAHRIAVTGTPVENRLADLWSIMEFANPGLLGTATSFKKRFAEPIERHGDEDAAAPAAHAHPAVRPAPGQDRPVDHLRPAGEAGDGGGLQPHRRAGLALPGGRRRHAGSASRRPTGIERRGLVLATMTKLKQVCNHPAQLLRDGSRAGRPLRASWHGWRRSWTRCSPPARRRCCSPSTPSSAGCCAAHLSAPGSAARCCSCTAGWPRPSATRWWPGSSRRRRRRRCSCCRSRPAAPG